MKTRVESESDGAKLALEQFLDRKDLVMTMSTMP
jgi:hypothetical protein